MAPKRMALLRWTGRGSQVDLQSSVMFVLKAKGVRGEARSSGESLVVGSPDPVGAAMAAEHLPGIAWSAVGFEVRRKGALSGAVRELATRYLRKGQSFWVEAEASGDSVGSDVAGAVTSGVLDAVKGVRVSARAPGVRFRAAFEGDRGVVGVEVRRGPGGVPTGSARAVCLVSGGRHSSVVAWWAALGGFRTTLVHAVASEESLLAVARLYSEISHRVDPRWLKLTAAQGGSVAGALAGLPDNGPVFGGFNHHGTEVPRALRGRVLAPLYLLPEERFGAEFESLGIREEQSGEVPWAAGGGEMTLRSFGGEIADVSDVLDGLA